MNHILAFPAAMSPRDGNAARKAWAAQAAPVPDEPLIGRSSQLTALSGLADRAEGGRAAAVILTGPAGSGRSTLLREFCAGMAAKAAVIQADSLDGAWSEASGTAEAPLQHGSLHSHRLHETVVELAARQRPVIVAVDDAHLSGPRSLRGLDYILRRSAGLPLLLAVTVPTGPGLREPPSLTALLTHHTWDTVELTPLAAFEVVEILTRRLGHRPDSALLFRCLEYSEGIPAAVHAFVDRSDGGRGSAYGATRLPLPGLAGRSERPCPGPLSGSASVVLTAVSVLGTADPQLVSGLTRMPLPAVRRTIAHLAEHRLLAPDGSGPLPESPGREVLRDVPHAELLPLFERAARLLEDAGRPPTEVADVLLRIGHSAAPWMLEALHRAALAAEEASRPALAVRYLQHALYTGAGHDSRALRVIRSRLAEILSATDPAAALPHLGVLLATGTDGGDLARTALRYANTLVSLGRGAEAARLLANILDRPAGRDSVTVAEEQRPYLESALLLSGTLQQTTIGWVRERSRACAEPDDDSPGSRRLRVARTMVSVLDGHPAPMTNHQVMTAATGQGTPLDDLSLLASAFIAHLTDDHRSAIETLDRILLRPAGQVAGPSHINALMLRASVLCGTGDLPAAERHGRHAVALARKQGDGPGGTAPSVVLAYVLAQRGETAAAEAVLAQVSSTELGRLFYVHPMYMWAKAAVRRAQGNPQGALVSLRACGRAMRPAGAETPVILPWWLEAADLLIALGRPADARRSAAHGVAFAERWDTSRGTGMALLARGMATPGRAGHQLLDEACAVLAESPARLLRARAEDALGRALLEHGDPRAARPRLRTALDLMIQCGAGEAAHGTRRRLAEAGGRPRQLTGCPGDALTSGEWRVAALAMEGRSNREIAETLYITRRTVELHLTHVYQKLGLSRRAELGSVLGGLRTTAMSGAGEQR